MEVRTEKSKILTNSTNNISANISMNTHKLEEVTSFKYREAKTLCKDGTFSAEVRDQNCFSNGSNSQTKQDLVVQHHQLYKQIQAPPVC